jgi:hypothetical protein
MKTLPSLVSVLLIATTVPLVASPAHAESAFCVLVQDTVEFHALQPVHNAGDLDDVLHLELNLNGLDMVQENDGFLVEAEPWTRVGYYDYVATEDRGDEVIYVYVVTGSPVSDCTVQELVDCIWSIIRLGPMLNIGGLPIHPSGALWPEDSSHDLGPQFECPNP